MTTNFFIFFYYIDLGLSPVKIFDELITATIQVPSLHIYLVLFSTFIFYLISFLFLYLRLPEQERNKRLLEISFYSAVMSCYMVLYQVRRAATCDPGSGMAAQAAEALQEIRGQNGQIPPQQIVEEVAPPPPPPPPPVIPQLAVPLIPDANRMTELHHRFCANSFIGRNTRVREMMEILDLQMILEKRMDAALVHDGINPQYIIENRRDLRGILFYNERGIAFSRRTLTNHLSEIDNLGTRNSIPYRRVLRAILSSR